MSETTSRGFTRRNFIKGAALLTATGALAGCAPQTAGVEETSATEVKPDEIYAGVCRGNCQGGCFLDVHVRDGQVVRTTAREFPEPQYNRICPRGLTHPYRMYSSERIQYPMKRVGERGEGKFERISWDEAIGTIVEKWNQYKEEYGPESFAIYTGSGSYGLVSSAQTYGSPFHRLINATGCTYINFVVDMAGIGVSSMISGAGTFSTSNEPTDMVNSKVILIWMANPMISHQHNMHFLMEAQEAGAKLVVIDPQYTNLAEKADLYIPIKPATDALLGIAMMKVMLNNHWENTDFLHDKTQAPFLVKSSDGLFLRTSDLDDSIAAEDAQFCVMDEDGEIKPVDEATNAVMEGSFATPNGLEVSTSYTLLLNRLDEYDLEDCSEKCGVSLDVIEELTDMYVNQGPSSIMKMMGGDHYTNGTSAYAAVNTLVMMAGQIGGSGKGFSMASSGGAIFDMATMALLTDPEAPQGKFGWMQFMNGMDVLVMDQVMEKKEYAGVPVNLKGMYCSHINFLVNAADRNYMLDWLDKVEFIAMADINMNESARYADILLPAAHWFEVEDVCNIFATHPYVLFQEKACEPLFEARPDFDIVKDIAEGVGAGKWFDMDAKTYIEMALNNETAQSFGITYDSLKEKKAIRVLPEDTYVYGDGEVFPTATGRLTFYIETPTPICNSGQEYDVDQFRMVHWEQPQEVGPGNPLREKYPYQLLSDHSRFRTHSQWWEVDALLEIDDYEPKVKISPADAEAIGIQEGDLVKLYNDRGYVVMMATINAGLPSGIVSAEKGWQDTQFRDGHFSSLSGHFSSPFIRNSAFNDVLVAIEKVS